MFIIPSADSIRKKMNGFINHEVRDFDFSNLFKHISDQIDACYKYFNDGAILFVKLLCLLNINQYVGKIFTLVYIEREVY